VERPGRMAYSVEHTALGSFGVDATGGIERPAVSRADRPGF
jgi:hypothetical protein